MTHRDYPTDLADDQWKLVKESPVAPVTPWTPLRGSGGGTECHFSAFKIQAASGGTSGYGAGKKTVGRQRLIVVDTLGLIWALAVTLSIKLDRDRACLVIHEIQNQEHFPENLLCRFPLQPTRSTAVGAVDIGNSDCDRPQEFPEFEVLPKR